MMAFRCAGSSSDSDDEEEEAQEPQFQARHRFLVYSSPTTQRRRAPRTPPISVSRSPKKLHRAQELRRHFPTLAPHIQAREAQHERTVLEQNYVSASMDNLNIDAAVRTSKSPTAASPPSSSAPCAHSTFRQRSSSVPRNFSRKSLVRSHSLRRVSTPAPRCPSPLARKNLRSAEVNARLRQSVRDTASLSPVQRTTRLPSSPTPVFEPSHPAKRAHVSSSTARSLAGSVSASALPLSPNMRRRTGMTGMVPFAEEREGDTRSEGEASYHTHTSITNTTNTGATTTTCSSSSSSCRPHRQRQPRPPPHSHSQPHLPTQHHPPASPLASVSMALATDDEALCFSGTRTPEPPSHQAPLRPPLLQSLSLPTTPMHDPSSSASSTFDLSD